MKFREEVRTISLKKGANGQFAVDTKCRGPGFHKRVEWRRNSRSPSVLLGKILIARVCLERSARAHCTDVRHVRSFSNDQNMERDSESLFTVDLHRKQAVCLFVHVNWRLVFPTETNQVVVNQVFVTKSSFWVVLFLGSKHH